MENSDYINDADEIGLYVMSVAAKLVGTHPQTLREYERRGLITPQRTEDRKSTRLNSSHT